MRITTGWLLAFAILATSAATGAAAPEVQLSVTVYGDGTVTSAPAGINCPADCTEAFKRNAAVTLTAAAGPTGTFEGWSGACAGTAPECIIARLSAATSVIATFSASSSPPVAPTAKTGITKCYGSSVNEIPCADTGQDGEFQAGASVAPPRYTINSDGTVDDRLTGLKWTGKSCGTFNWDQAAAFAATLGSGNCGLTDGSQAGDWRVPNILELLSLLDWQTGDIHECAIKQSNGTSCAMSYAWSSTPYTWEGTLGFYSVQFGTREIVVNSVSNLIPVRKQ